MGELHPCFFCNLFPGSGAFGIEPPDRWPDPLPQNARLLVCHYCSTMTEAEVYRHAHEYAARMRRYSRLASVSAN